MLPLELPLEVRLPLLSPIQRAMALCQVINGTCAGVPFVFGRRGERRCHGLDMRMPFTHAVFAFVGWAITVRGNHVYDRLSGPRHRLDVSISAAGDAARRDLPHGACDLASHTRCQTSPTPARVLRRLAWPILLRRRQARRQARRLPRSRSLHHERHGGGCHRRNCRHVRGGLAARDRLCLLQVRCQATAGRCQATAAVLIGGGSADGRLGRVGLMHSTSLVGPW